MITDAEAQAVTAVANTTGEVVKAAGGLGSYLAKTFGSIPEDTLGLIGGDWLSHKRRRHLATLEANTVRHFEGVDAQRLTEPSPSILIPLLQAAVDEGRAELQDLWAALLANAMVDGGRRVRRDYFDAVRQMEPVDALVLDIIGCAHRDTGAHEIEPMIAQQLANRAISTDDYAIALLKLKKLDCVNDQWPPRLMPFGRGLLLACAPP
jgi:hypothetical protein